MKRYILLFLLATFLSTIAKVSPYTRMVLQNPCRQIKAINEQPREYLPLLVMIDHDSIVDILADMGSVIYNRRNNILLTSIPKDIIDTLETFDGIVYLDACGRINSDMDQARAVSGVDAAHAGTTLSTSYDGKGVIVGFSDIGFDPNHIAFSSNLKEVHHFDGRRAVHLSASDADEISAWTTDTLENWHATHVGNILAGGHKESGYYGVAPGADIVATTSDLYSPTILAGVEEIIAYAKKHNSPAVINLSLSSPLGARDGSSLECQYLSACAEEAAICVSAANSGHKKVFCQQLLSSEFPMAEVKIFDPILATATECKGYIDIWNETSLPLEFRFGAYNEDTNELIYTTDWLSIPQDENLILVNTENFPLWGEFFNGEIAVYDEVNPFNGRYNALARMELTCEIQSDRGKWSKYMPTLSIRQKEDVSQRIHVFAESLEFGKVKGGVTTPDASGSINNLATAKGVLSVGMCQTRNTYPTIGEPYVYTFTTPMVAPESSYSSTDGIEPLPHICAPGKVIMSAVSNRYMERHPEVAENLTYYEDASGVKHYWMSAYGTSMSSPYAAGVLALWLQANPSLTPAELIDIAVATADKNYADINNPRWGAGCIDSMAGLRYVVAGVNDIGANTQPIIEVSPSRTMSVTMPGGVTPNFKIYSVTGVSLPPHSTLSPGVYIIVIPGYSPVKTIVK